MPQPLVAGNWKMHGSRRMARDLVEAIKQGRSEAINVGVALCPPFVYLNEVAGWLEGADIALGSQDVCEEPDEGAYTGEVSAAMLRDVGCAYAIIGHSERRSLYGETSAWVARKFIASQQVGLTPILCVGEQLDEREAGRTEIVVSEQLNAVIEAAGVSVLAKAVVAYEPVWAIGTGRTATPEQAQEVHAFIRRHIGEHDPTVAKGLQILYGGSVKAANAADLFTQADVDGGLIGGASLKPQEFLGICRAAND